METHARKPRVFISHSSRDKHFVERLAQELKQFGVDVWYDDWEIAVGDSIIEKVFAGLDASDTLIVVLSPASIDSRWVKEELNTAMTRRISENSVRVLPILFETCDLPSALRHIRYADFRGNHEVAMAQLFDSLAPCHHLWQTLEQMYDHLCMVCDQLVVMDLNADASDKILKIHFLLEAALNVRTDIEFRRSRERMRDLSFFGKIGMLVEKGVDVRSRTWNTLVQVRSIVAHDLREKQSMLALLAHMLKERYASDDIKGSFVKGLGRYKEVMHMLCFEDWNRYGTGGKTSGEPGA